jgi:hypothetical protein
LLSIGLGCLGLSVNEFYEMRPVHFFMKLGEYNREQEQKFRLDAELIRLQTTTLVNIQLPENKKINPASLWKFPWDNDIDETIKQLDKKDFEEQYKNYINRKNGRSSS